MFKELKLKNSFRILKGGKISLVVSALVLSAGLVTSANAEELGINDSDFRIATKTVLGLNYVSNAVTINYTEYNAANGPDEPTQYTIDSVIITEPVNKTINFGSGFDITNNSGFAMNLGFLIDTTINNYGKFASTNSGHSTVNVYGAYSQYVESNFYNYGTIENTSDNVDAPGYALKLERMNFFNEAAGIIRGNIKIIRGNLTNDGTISLPYNANGSNDDVALSAIINGTFTNNGTLEIGVKKVGEVLSYSKLGSSSAIFANGSKLKVNVLDQENTNGLLLAGTVLVNVVSADNTITDYGLVIEDNSALVDFQKELGGVRSLNLRVVKASSNNIVDSTIAGGGKSPAKFAAKTLQFIQDGGNHPQMNTVFTQLNNLTSNEAVAIAVESTTPQSTTSTQTASNQISNNISNVVMQRQNPNFGGGLNSGDEIFEDKNLWIKPFGSIGSQANKDGMNGFDVKSYGLGMGFDGKNKSEQLFGFGLFFTDANVEMNNVSQESDIKAYSMMAYGSLPVIDNKTNFLYQLGYSLQNTDSSRDVFTGDTATADYTSKMASIDLRLVRDYQINKDLMVQPLTFATYRNFKSPSYSETGAGVASLDVEKSSSSEMIVGLGTIATYKLNASDKLIGSLNVGYDLKDDQNMVNSSYQGASGVSFETQGIDNGRWSYDAGVGYEKSIDNKNSVSINYNFQGEGSDYTNNVVSANYVLKF
jgi:outer membrane autotransporter protein